MDNNNNKTLEDVIKQHVHLQAPSKKGWQAVRCHVCNDHTRKGLRGSFKFENGVVDYKCWNCGHSSRYNPEENEYYSKNMLTTLEAFNIPEDEYQAVILNSPAWQHGAKKSTHDNKKVTKIEPRVLKMPPHFYYLKDAAPDDFVAEAAIEYLEGRGVDPNSYPFMLAHKVEDPKLMKLNKWLGRVIMPIYKNNNLIYYIGRALYDAERKYETPATEKDKILFGFDHIFEYTDAPIFVVEGWFDAFAIGGVAVLGNIISEPQRIWLDKSQREKIYIPDRFGDGKRAAEQALDFGWSISTPDIGSDPKDMDEAVQKYGKIYVIKSILENKATRETGAETLLGNYCIS
jgi:hypothetical protein